MNIQRVNTRAVRVLALVPVAAVALAACGGDDDTPGTTAPAAATSPAGQATTEPGSATLPGDVTIPEGITIPAGITIPDNLTIPPNLSVPDGVDLGSVQAVLDKLTPDQLQCLMGQPQAATDPMAALEACNVDAESLLN